jgi:hypothetical protein
MEKSTSNPGAPEPSFVQASGLLNFSLQKSRLQKKKTETSNVFAAGFPRSFGHGEKITF